MIVVDTCAVLWDALEPSKLSRNAARALHGATEESGGLILCEITLWEIAMLLKLKRVKVDCSYRELMDLILASRPYHLRGISPEIADLAIFHLSDINKDPADRLIAATALSEKVPLVTADTHLRHSKEIETIW